MGSIPIRSIIMIEKEKFLNYVRGQSEKGLIDIKLFLNPDAKPTNEEELYAELNRMVEAPDVPDTEVLGVYGTCHNKN
jgi:hypothetical protein